MSTHVLHAAGGLGLFLLGMWVMTTGLKELAGPSLARGLARFTRSPLSGAATGAGVTALIQSSSATTLAAVGFVSAGLLTFPQALGILFGANVGTTVTGWLVALLGFKLDLGEIAPLIVLAGVLVRLFTRGPGPAIGIALAGFGLVFVGIEALREGMASFEGRLTPQSFPADGWMGRFKLVVLGVVVTLVTQSSSAGVATAIAAVHAGAMTLPQAAAIVVGMDVGTTGTAIVSAVGASTQARRTAASHVLYNSMTGVVAFASIPLWIAGAERLTPAFVDEQPEVALVAFHSLFNLLGVIVVLPFTARFARLVERIVPDRPGATDRLDRALLREVPVAVETVDHEVRRLSIELFDALARRAVRGAPVGLDEDAWTRGTSDAREFLGDITTRSSDGELHRRHVALIHVVDHLDRLFERRAPRLRPDDAGDDDLRRQQAALATDFAHAADALRSGKPPSQAVALERWRAARRFAEPYRRRMVSAAAADSVDDRTVLGRIDEARRLGRNAYHLWRLSSQLEEALLRPGVTT